jgi:hypothetical protein
VTAAVDDPARFKSSKKAGFHFGHCFDQTGKAGNAQLRLDWLAGSGGFEPRYVILKNPL